MFNRKSNNARFLESIVTELEELPKLMLNLNKKYKNTKNGALN